MYTHPTFDFLHALHHELQEEVQRGHHTSCVGVKATLAVWNTPG